MRTVAGLLVLGLALAGCQDGAKEEEVPVDVPEAEELGLEATEETGVLVGIVLDRAFKPVKGADVVLEGNGTVPTQAKQTDDAGIFGFDGLPGGLYVLHASKLGWNGTTLAAEVVAGVSEPEPVRIFLDRDPAKTPSIHMQTGRFQVTGGYVGALLVRNPALTGNSSYVAVFEVGPGLAYVQGELVWEATSPAAEDVSFYCGVYNNGDSDWTGEVNSTAGPTPRAALVTVPEGASVNRAQCAMWAYDPDVPAALAVEQDYQLYITEFYHMAPNPGWTFVQDGEHPAPPE